MGDRQDEDDDDSPVISNGDLQCITVINSGICCGNEFFFATLCEVHRLVCCGNQRAVDRR